MSINLHPEWNSLFRKSKDEKSPLKWLLASKIELLIFCCCLEVMFSKEKQWSWEDRACLLSRSDLIAWLWRSIDICNWCLLLSFWRCRWMGIRPVITLISKVEEVQKTPVIYNTTLCCILLSSLSRYDNSALL